MIGLIPAAGRATRMGGLPKFLLPIPGGFLLDTLCKRMLNAGVQQIYVGANYDNSHLISSNVPRQTYTYIADTATMSQTVQLAPKPAHDEPVLFGMPDSYWVDADVYRRLAMDIADGALVSAALFTVGEQASKKLGMCSYVFDNDETLIVTKVEDKPTSTTMRRAWGALAWNPPFWKYINPQDPHVGFAVQRAIEDHKIVRAYLAQGPYFDCGTPEDYFACVRYSTAMEVQGVD
jgi:CTP:molybdopterin cytidylyltransferase MocA